jgi:hypothetical protein
MKKLLMLFFSIIFLACSQTEKLPPGIAAPDKMKHLFFDLYLVDAVNTERKLRDSGFLLQVENHKDFVRVLEIHGMNRKSFQKNFSYYKKHPQLMKRVTDSLAAYAARRSAELLTDTTKRNLHGTNIQDTAGQARN